MSSKVDTYNAPFYFSKVQAAAKRRWDQLESDPDLAGPWYQLFKQVQSPRHVLSELLQNADDADAEKASGRIEDAEFIFEHDGNDFNEEQFKSLCQFGFSNKRNLHTIGFRGVGFKSTFSLGDEVRLFTSTLSVAFRRRRFTEPMWRPLQHSTKTTQVRIKIEDGYRQGELQKNLDEWKASPLSMLFFRRVRHLEIDGIVISRHHCGPGPVGQSEWVKVGEDREEPFLLVRSAPEYFPDEALEEIRQERMGTDDLQLPACEVELVAGVDSPGHLFVILPTAVETRLPFDCNAPFVQDPARTGLKDPETSPANRWLLQRVGRLAASAMTEWLQHKDIPLEQRCRAYIFFPDVDREDTSPEGVAAAICEEAFDDAISGERVVITESGDLVGKGCAITVPAEIYNIWTARQITCILNQTNRSLLCRHVNSQSRKILANWGLIEKVETAQVVDALERTRPPKPQTWRQLLLLWDLVAEEVTKVRYGYYHSDRRNLRIVPVQGKEVLYPASEVIRLGEKKLLPPEDWDFLAGYMLVLNPNWPRFLAEQRRKAEEKKNEDFDREVANAYSVLARLDLDKTSSSDRLMAQVTPKFFGREKIPLRECVRLAQIAASLGAAVPESFQYVTVNGYRKSPGDIVVADSNGDLDMFVDDKWYKEHVLASNYHQEFTACKEAEWNAWVKSQHSRLITFVPIYRRTKYIHGRKEICSFLAERKGKEIPYFPYVTDSFEVEDMDFKAEHWDRWETLAQGDPLFWGKLLTRILQLPRLWTNALSADAVQIATTGNTRRITDERLLPAWIMKFRTLRCLQDTHGNYREPAELLRRTPQTESLLDVEPFIRAEYDTEAARPLLVALGVRDTPTGPDHLVERLRALATVANPPVYEVEKWYHRLDQLLVTCSTDELQKLKDVFAAESLILTDSGEWAKSPEVFIDANPEDVPGAATVHSSVRHLSLWHKVGIADRPTVNLILEWLGKIPSGNKLSPDELRTVRSLLSRHAAHIWQQCRHWLNLEGEWIPTEQLKYKITMQSLVLRSNLFPATKRKTANLQDLPAELSGQHPFAALSNLAGCIEEQISQEIRLSSSPEQKVWMQELGKGLSRVIYDDQEKTELVRQLGQRLAKTRWCYTKGLKSTPYIDGTPVGTARKIPVAWNDQTLYVERQELTSLIRNIAQELAGPFGEQEISDAIKICVDRDGDFVIRYLESNFKIEHVTEPRDTRESQGKPTLGVDDTEGKSGVEEPRETTTEPPPQAPQGESPVETTTTITRTIIVKPPQPKFIEIYAKKNGYEKDSDSDIFYHSDGSSIRKSENSSFHWEKYSREGQIVQSYWLKEHCLQKSPLQLDAVVWQSCQDHPDKYTLVLADADGNPTELSGHELQKLLKSGKVKLYPAEYRLTYEA